MDTRRIDRNKTKIPTDSAIRGHIGPADMPEQKPEQEPEQTEEMPRIFSKKKATLAIFATLALLLIFSEAFGLVSIFGQRSLDFSLRGQIDILPGSQIATTPAGIFIAAHSYLRLLDVGGSEIFRHNYTLDSPWIVSRGNYAAAIGSSRLAAHIYSGSGLSFSVDSPSPILNFSLAKNGYFATITHSGGNYYIHIYNRYGRINRGRHVDENIVPMAIDVSHDGRFLAISYVDINDAAINSLVKFFFLREDDYLANHYIDGIFAMSIENRDQIIGSLHFMENNRLLAISESRIFMIDPQDGARTIWEISLSNRIRQIVAEDDWFAVIYGEHIAGMPPVGQQNNIAAYSADGNRIFSANLSGIQGIDSFGGNLLIFTDTESRLYSVRSGQLLWQHATMATSSALIGDRGLVEIIGQQVLLYSN